MATNVKMYSPLDPNCPVVHNYEDTLLADPMARASGAPVDDIMEMFYRRHHIDCLRCQEYGAANIAAR